MEKILRKGLKGLLTSISSKHWLEQMIDEYLDAVKNEDRSGTQFHPSWAGKCQRLVQFMMHDSLPNKVEARVQRIFDNGKDMHLRYQKYFEKAGHLVQDEAKFTLNVSGLTIVGSADMIIKDWNNKPFIVELKSMNDRLFGALKEPVDINFQQWNIYSRGLEIPDGVILYENKNDQSIKAYNVTFDEARFWKNMKIFSLILEYDRKGMVVPKPMACENSRWCPALPYCKIIEQRGITEWTNNMFGTASEESQE